MSFNHFDTAGNARVVDISQKDITTRSATAKGFVRMNSNTLEKIQNKDLKKGDVLTVAQLAGIMGAKKTPELIPLAHPILLDNIVVLLTVVDNGIQIEATCKVNAKTGVEMEAITAVAISALTVYDMCKSMDKTITIENIGLIHKIGGKSGEFKKD